METSSAVAAVDDREDIQKKTFGKWLNSQLDSAPHPSAGKETAVTDLFYDLRDGLVLLSVLEVLTGKKIRRERGSLRVHQLANVNAVLSMLRENRVKLVNIGTVDIVDGNSKITLALVWAVILHWQFDKVLGAGLQHVSNLERSLLDWCRRSSAKLGVVVKDFTSSFQDGLAFAAIVHAHRPHLFDFATSVRRKEPLERLDFAFGVIKQHLGISRLLDPCVSSIHLVDYAIKNTPKNVLQIPFKESAVSRTFDIVISCWFLGGFYFSTAALKLSNICVKLFLPSVCQRS
jgi:dystrophin